MPLIRRLRQKDQVTVTPGANLMRSLQEAGIAIASSCAGEAVCAKCVLRVLEGAENLSPPTEEEIFLKEKEGFAPEMRISCQCQVLGDLVVDASYW